MRPASKYELPDLAEAVRQINADLSCQADLTELQAAAARGLDTCG